MQVEITITKKSNQGDVERILREADLPLEGLTDQFHNFYIAQYDDKVVGVIGLEVFGRYGLLRSCCVIPEHQNENIGTLLTRRIIDRAKELGLAAVYLLTESKESFFARQDFVVISRDQISPDLRESALMAGNSCCSKASAMVLELAATDDSTSDQTAILEAVRDKYADRARGFAASSSSCCGSSSKKTFVTKGLYDNLPEGIPDDALLASLGCGNPTYLAYIEEGETVLDLGCGGGLDVFLSAKRVGPSGKVYGLDMTDEMLELARANQRNAGIKNVDFLKGHMEAIPLPPSSLDLIISNCVINLSPDKDKVFEEAFRVLKPNGRLAISDIVFLKNVPPQIKRNMEAWAGCIAGALEKTEYITKLQKAGFVDVDIETTRVYELRDFEKYPGFLELPEQEKSELEGVMTASFVRASKPALAEQVHSSCDDEARDTCCS